MTPDYKSLKKIADACRKAGIKQYKCQEFEFTLADEVPVSNYKKRKQSSGKLLSEIITQEDEIESDSLTNDALLFWSTGNPENKDSESTQ